MDIISLALAVLLFALGAVVGSFLNVVIYRLPRGESVVFPNSHCPRCGRALTPGDLVPLLSWLLLRGHCRSCAVRISSRYFWIELLTGVLFVGCGLTEHFQITWALAHKLILVALFIPIIFIDQDRRIVPDELTVPLLLLGFVWNVTEGLTGNPWAVTLDTHSAGPLSQLTVPGSILFAAACAGIFWLIQWFGEVTFKREAMGLGDVNIAAGIGANFPFLASLCSFALAIGLGAVIGVGLILLGRRDRSGQMAFGPMLLVGALVMLLIPDPVYHAIEWYRSSWL